MLVTMPVMRFEAVRCIRHAALRVLARRGAIIHADRCGLLHREARLQFLHIVRKRLLLPLKRIDRALELERGKGGRMGAGLGCGLYRALEPESGQGAEGRVPRGVGDSPVLSIGGWTGGHLSARHQLPLPACPRAARVPLLRLLLPVPLPLVPPPPPASKFPPPASNAPHPTLPLLWPPLLV